MTNIQVLSLTLPMFATLACGAPAAQAPAPYPAAPLAPAAGAPAAPAALAAPATPAASAAAAPPATANATAAPAAPSAAPAGPPMPSKELEAFMKGFDGSWNCETRFAAGAMGPGSPETKLKSTVKFTKEFDGFSWHGEYKVPKSKTMPGMTGALQMGYDSGSKQITLVAYDSTGSAMFGAGPISGESVTIIEDAYMMGMKMKVRETMTKKGPKEAYHKMESDMGNGFQLMGEDTCKK